MKMEIKKNGCKAVIKEILTGITFHFYVGKILQRGTIFSKNTSIKDILEYFEKCILEKENSNNLEKIFA
jgi:hypothetical protein